MKNQPNIISGLIYSGLIVFALCFFVLSAPNAQAQSDTLIIGTATGDPGQIVDMNIYLANHSSSIAGFYLMIYYNQNAFGYEEIIELPRASGFMINASVSGDSIRISGYDPTGDLNPIESGAGDILQLRFSIDQNTVPGDYEIQFADSANNYLYGHSGSIYPLLVDGNITVTGQLNISGNAEYETFNFSLANNYPNPFNSSTNIEYTISEYADVSITIYNLLGQEVRILVSQPLNPGKYITHWDGKNNSGEVLSSGVYLYKISVDNNYSVKMLNFVK